MIDRKNMEADAQLVKRKVGGEGIPALQQTTRQVGELGGKQNSRVELDSLQLGGYTVYGRFIRVLGNAISCSVLKLSFHAQRSQSKYNMRK